MASRIEFAVSMTPIKTIAASGDSPDVDVMATDIGKTLGSNGTVLTGDASGDHATDGYTAGVPSEYKNANPGDNFDCANKDFLFVRHTGKEYDTINNSIGTDDTEEVLQLRTATIDGSIFAVLHKGEALVIPRPASDIFITSGDTIAVEFAVINDA